MVILATSLLVGAVSLCLLGRDQVQYDQIPVCPPGVEEECGAPDHAGFGGAVKAMVYVGLGDVGVQGDFGLGTGGTGPALWLLFIALSFFIIIHMMNMLVAVMGDTQASNAEVAELLLTKSRLKFVMDNWLFDALGKEKERIRYIVAALSHEEEDEDTEMAREIHGAIHEF